MNYKVNKEDRIERNKKIISDYLNTKNTLKQIALDNNVSKSTVEKVIAANVSKEQREGVREEKHQRYKYEYTLVDKGIYEIKLATGEVRYEVHSTNKNTGRRFKTFEEAENFVSDKDLLEKEVETCQFPLNAIDAIFGNNNVMFDNMDYVINNFEVNFKKLTDVLLNEKEREIVYLRFKDGYTLESIGKKYGLTRERIRQILEIIIRKFRTSRMSYDYLNKGATTILISSEIAKLEKELELRKSALEDKIQKTETNDENSGLNQEELMRIKMSQDEISKYSLKLKVRTISSLTRAGYETVGEVVDLIEKEGGYDYLLRKIRNFGLKSAKDLKSMLKRVYGYVYKRAV